MKDLEKPINITITAGAIIKTIFVLILFYVLFVLRDLLLALLTAVVIASAIEPGTSWLIKRKIPRTLAVLIIYVLGISFCAFIFYLFVPILLQETQSLFGNLPLYVNTISDKVGILREIPAFNQFIAQLSENIGGGNLVSTLGGPLTGATYSFFSLASVIFGGIFSFILIVVFSFYLAAQEDGVSSFLKIVTPIQYENYVLDLWKRARRKIGLWMQGQLLLGLLVGVLTYLGLSILGVQNALLLALVAAVFELIPVFGPILSAVPAVLLALFQDGATFALIVVGLYVIIQQFENHLIHPLVVKKIVGIPALIAILALIVGAQLAGFLGMILAVPVSAAIMEYISDIEKKKKTGQ